MSLGKNLVPVDLNLGTYRVGQSQALSLVDPVQTGCEISTHRSAGHLGIQPRSIGVELTIVDNVSVGPATQQARK